MTKAILITKEFLDDMNTSDFYDNCSKIEHFWQWSLGDGKYIDCLTRYKFYLDKNGNKKTSTIYYQKHNGKWEQSERLVRDGFRMPETLAEKLKRIMKGESGEIYYYPKSLSGQHVRTPSKKSCAIKINFRGMI